MVGAVRVGVGPNVKVDIVHYSLDFRFVGILKQIVNEVEHQDPACGLITMNSAGVEELGLAVSCAIVEMGNHNLAATGQRAERDDFALVRVVVLEIKHHGFVSLIGRVAVPIVFGAVATVPHGNFLKQRRRCLKGYVISKSLEFCKIIVVGVGGHHLAVNAVNRNGTGDGI